MGTQVIIKLDPFQFDLLRKCVELTELEQTTKALEAKKNRDLKEHRELQQLVAQVQLLKEHLNS